MACLSLLLLTLADFSSLLTQSVNPAVSANVHRSSSQAATISPSATQSPATVYVAKPPDSGVDHNGLNSAMLPPAKPYDGYPPGADDEPSAAVSTIRSSRTAHPTSADDEPNAADLAIQPSAIGHPSTDADEEPNDFEWFLQQLNRAWVVTLIIVIIVLVPLLWSAAHGRSGCPPPSAQHPTAFRRDSNDDSSLRP